MKLTNFIKALQKIEAAEPGNGELPVCLSDWGENCSPDNEEVAERIAVKTGEYYAETARTRDGNGKFVIIGDYDHR